MSKTEKQLINIAQNNPCDIKAGEAMKELKERFCNTYFWCWDCDGVVCKESECCLNRSYDKNNNDHLDIFD